MDYNFADTKIGDVILVQIVEYNYRATKRFLGIKKKPM